MHSGNSISDKNYFQMLFLRFICLKQLNKNGEDCANFEARFCCPNATNSQTEFNSTSEDIDNGTWPETLNDLRKFKQSALI